MSYFACESNKGVDIVGAQNKEQATEYLKTCYGDDVKITLVSDDPDDIEIADAIGATIHDLEW